jgi:polyadenylation factor subunit 2
MAFEQRGERDFGAQGGGGGGGGLEGGTAGFGRGRGKREYR